MASDTGRILEKRFHLGTGQVHGCAMVGCKVNLGATQFVKLQRCSRQFCLHLFVDHGSGAGCRDDRFPAVGCCGVIHLLKGGPSPPRQYFGNDVHARHSHGHRLGR